MSLEETILAAIALADAYPAVHEKLNDALTFLAAAQERNVAATAAQPE